MATHLIPHHAQPTRHHGRTPHTCGTRYSNPWGNLRVGRIFEDLDALAGNIAFQHCDDGDSDTIPPLLVTASGDLVSSAALPGCLREWQAASCICVCARAQRATKGTSQRNGAQESLPDPGQPPCPLRVPSPATHRQVWTASPWRASALV